eukprot:11417630-Alexandrium_andersonii.AAC.1
MLFRVKDATLHGCPKHFSAILRHVRRVCSDGLMKEEGGEEEDSAYPRVFLCEGGAEEGLEAQ